MIRKAADMQKEVREKMRGGPGAVTVTHCFKPAEFGASLRLCARLTLPPGAGIGLHEHAGEDEVYYIIKGSGAVDEGSGKVAVAAGDAILTGKGASHSIENTGKEALEMLAVIATYPKA
jgi:mannose-6-phosphate isomerase-like protein (cupin superfamily)